MATNSAFLAAVAAAAVSISVLLCIKRAFFSPLSRIPGPWYARITHLWLKKHVLAGRRLHYVHDMHLKYGPIIQVSPTEIDVADPEVYKEVHKIGSGFLKDPWYQASRKGDAQGLFTMIDPKVHSSRRRMFAPLWTNSALHQNWEPVVAEKTRLTIAGIKREALNGEADVFKWWTFMSTDVISHLAFGESVDMLKQEKRNAFIEDMEQALQISGIFAELPLLRYILKPLPFEWAKHILTADDRVQTYGEDAIAHARSGSLCKENVFSKFIAENEKDGSSLTNYEVAFEAANFIVAGSGTTAVSLTYLVWAVLMHPTIRSRLEDEVAQLPADADDTMMEKLPFLNAVIDETLRLYGAAPGSLPRQCPKGGAQLGGYFIPGRTTVSSQAYTLHRDESVYQDAERFNPNRFIDEKGSYSPPKASFAPFGAGSRTCLGIHLAKIEMRHGTFAFFRECRGAKIASSMKARDMDMLNYFLISPLGNKCCIELQ